MRAEHGGLTLEEFKRMLREQFFALLLDRDEALAAIPKMLPADAAVGRRCSPRSGGSHPPPAKSPANGPSGWREIEKLFQAIEPVKSGSGKGTDI
jgi:hypothetical protein